MFGFVIILLISSLVGSIEGKNEQGKCKVTMSRPNTREFNCIGLTSISNHLEKAPVNTTEIDIVHSAIPHIPPHSFIRFGATLENLDLHDCKIVDIHVQAFTGLIQLKKLILSENKLPWIIAEWFRHLTNLRYLDVSLNELVGMDNVFYQMLPNLETFYFDYNKIEAIDYNMFPLLSHLKSVKFGKNPWNWGYRVLLTWQLENQRVDYRDDWEEWGWMSNVVRECQVSGQGSTVNEAMLDCAVLKLLRMDVGQGHVISHPGTRRMATQPACLPEATNLVRCTKSSGRESLRRTIEGLAGSLRNMRQSNGKFNPKFIG